MTDDEISVLRRELNRYQAVKKGSPDLLVLINREGVYLDVVPGRYVQPIASPDKVIGKRAGEIGEPELGRQTIEKAREAMDTGQIVTWEFQIPECPEVTYEARFIASGPDECLILVRDVSRWHALHRELEQLVQARTAELQDSNDELRQFAYAASHDLREPLHKISSFGARLKEIYGDQLDPKGAQYLEVMLSASDRMLSLIDDLLTYTRIGRKSNPFEWVELNDMVIVAQDILSEQILSSGAVFEIEPLPRIWADPHQVQLLFQNLLSNAVKFRKPGEPPRIQVSSRAEGPFHVVEVRDSGIGFDPRYKEKIFQIFERLHTRFNYPGTGVGLALCRRIAERFGGWIEGDGTPGVGAVFRVGFPVVTEH